MIAEGNFRNENAPIDLLVPIIKCSFLRNRAVMNFKNDFSLHLKLECLNDVPYILHLGKYGASTESSKFSFP